MDTNDQDTQESVNPAEDKTSPNNDQQVDSDTQKKIQTLDAQRRSWREKAVDPKTGKTYKELFEEREKSSNVKKEDQTSEKNDHALSEPDYGKLAYLNSVDVKHPDDQKAVLDEATRLKLPISDVVQMEHIKTRLKNNADSRAAQDAMPQGGSRGAPGVKDVDYWLAKGELPPDQETAQKVVNAKMARESTANTFADQMY